MALKLIPVSSNSLTHLTPILFKAVYYNSAAYLSVTTYPIQPNK